MDAKLQDAVARGSIRMVDELTKGLLARLFKVNGRTEKGMTALMGACGNGFFDIAKLLIDRGARVNVRDKSGSTPFSLACWRKREDIGVLLLLSGANPYFAMEPFYQDPSSRQMLEDFLSRCRSQLDRSMDEG